MITLHKLTAPVLGVVSLTVFGASPECQIYPSGDMVPENLLRIEVRTSTRLHPALGLAHLRLLNATGGEIEDPFLDLILPSADGKRHVVLLHPGRVKSGVGANLVLGRALRAGETVTLAIAHPAVGDVVRKTWRVTAFDTESPDPAAWHVQSPRQGDRSPLVITLDAPLSSSAENMIAVRTRDGAWLAGSGCFEKGETVWRFVPAQPWQAGDYVIVTHPDMEDPAGNRPGLLFESRHASAVAAAAGATLPFEVTR